ncbi:6-hydroxymethylpterin diphosphokinase MptE-like protein [Vibrio cholerae]|uniref:6-hydroxymethylpterin diphosphokinase MptE-like protein n=1 Tax=Vibrio cholerae TaxID=666 RepID=UPI003080DEB7
MGKHKGETCYILANGPSVLTQNLSILKGNNIISMNASPLLEDKYGFKSKYYVVSDTRFFDVESKRELARAKELDRFTTCIYRYELKDYNVKGENNYFVKSIGRDGFSGDLNNGFYFGCTTTMLALQLAFYLGFSEINLLGVDLIYPKESPRFYDEENVSPIDSNNCIQIYNIRESFKFLNENSVYLYNCSENSLLRPYIPFRKLGTN